MRPLVLFLYRQLFAAKRSQQLRGFTLLELLISLVISSIVIASLLFGVVQLTTIEKRESNLDQVQRDMNRAMKYITNDLQEAVYVYPNPQQIATQIAGDTSFPGNAGEVPVLAFWRIDPIEDGLPDCSTMTGAVLLQCQQLVVRQAAYTLVVYVQKTNDNSNRNWSGQSRIIRYELSKYRDTIPADLSFRPGYRDPTDPTDALAQFNTWQPSGTPEGFSAVLVDYVQNPTPPVALNRSPLNDGGGACNGYGQDASNNPLYTVSPPTATTTINNSFFACVRNPLIGGANQGSQDVYVFLRGNVQSISGGVRGYSEETSLPILETRVLVRGVINKGFNQ